MSHLSEREGGPATVHFAVQFSRYEADGTKLGSYPSMWIITKQGGRWGIQARSSFLPEPTVPVTGSASLHPVSARPEPNLRTFLRKFPKGASRARSVSVCRRFVLFQPGLTALTV
jgi:hypothetical protein